MLAKHTVTSSQAKKSLVNSALEAKYMRPIPDPESDCNQSLASKLRALTWRTDRYYRMNGTHNR